MNTQTDTEGINTYLIPDEKRNQYFDFVDMFTDNVKNVTPENWDTLKDPFVTIDFSDFTFHQVLAIKSFMSRIDANNITETLRSKNTKNQTKNHENI